MALTPGALSPGTAASPPTGPVYPLTSGATSGPSAVFPTGSVSPSNQRLQLLSVINSAATTPEAPSSIDGAGLTWTRLKTISLTVANVTISVFAASGATAVPGPLNIRFLSPQEDCLWSWCEVENITSTVAAAIIQSNAVRDQTLADGQLEIPLNTFAHVDNITYGAFLHNKATSDPLTGSPGVDFSIIHQQQAVGAGYSINLLTEFKDGNDQTVDAQWPVSGYLAGIAIEIGNRNVVMLTSVVDVTIQANPVVNTVLDGFIATLLSERTSLDAAVIGEVKSNCQIDCFVESVNRWKTVDIVGTIAWRDV